MITYKVTPAGGAWYVVVKESGAVVSGPWERKGGALADANERASQAPGNRVES